MNKMYQALIIEDEQKLSEALLMLLECAVPGKVTVLGIATQVGEAIQMIDTLRPDLVFMDIQLKDGTAFQILEQVAYKNFHPIFTTAFHEHAIRAFKYGAMDYLLKPIDLEELKNAVDRIELLQARFIQPAQLQLLQKNLRSVPDHISLPTQAGLHIVSLNDIIRCEASGSYTTFYLVLEKSIMVSKPLKHYEDLLFPPHFFRIHQSHTVNLRFVKTYSKDGILTLKDHTVLSVAQRKKEEFLKFLKNQAF